MGIRRFPSVLTLLIGVSLFTAAVVFAQDEASTESDPQEVATSESEQKAQRKQILLTIGEDKLLDIDFEANEVEGKGIVDGNPAVVKTQLIKIKGKPKQLVLKPLKDGTSTVTVRDKDATVKLIIDVTVASVDLQRMLDDLKGLLGDIEGISLRILGKNIIIDGEVYSPADYGRLIHVVMAQNSPYAAVVVNLATFSNLALQALARRIASNIKSFASGVEVSVVNGRIWLTGQVENRGQADRAFKVANLYVPDLRPMMPLERYVDAGETAFNKEAGKLVQNFILINEPPAKKEEKQIRVTVHFVELSKDYVRNFGFKWQPGFEASGDSISIGTGGDGATGAGTLSFAATISNLFPRLAAAQSAGFARILKSGTMIVKNAQAATIRDETEFSFSLGAGNSQQATSAEKAVTGLSVAVTPKILGKTEDIEMDLDMNQVNLQGTTPQGSPITAKHAVKTKIFVRSNESAAVSAVKSEEAASDFNKDDPAPGAFSSGGALFTMLRSKAYRKKKYEYVIFVTPQIIENASDGTGDLKKNFRVKVN